MCVYGVSVTVCGVCAEQSVRSCCSFSSVVVVVVSSLVVAKVKIVVAYVASCAPTDAAKQSDACGTQQHLAIGTAGADATHPLGECAPPAATWTLPTRQVLASTPQLLTSLAPLEDATQRLAPEETL